MFIISHGNKRENNLNNSLDFFRKKLRKLYYAENIKKCERRLTMRSKFKFKGVMMLTGCTLVMTSISIYASEVPQIHQQKMVPQQQVILSISDNILEGKQSENGNEKGIFTTKYRVSVKKATMRFGPGTNYPSLGTLYKDDVVWVR